ncbi:MAG: hypothetical protein IPK16_12155 [Anaerolineales bacterium]|nr:hypothetical protein [Anaerolineales bacterium]
MAARGVLLVNHGDTDIEMRPLFRNWGEQTVWFDEIQFQPLTGLDVASLPDWKITWEYTDELRDVLAARYLLLAKTAIAADDQSRALQWLDAVLDLYPDDLYANYYRRLFTRSSQDTDDPHLPLLQHFTEAGLLPSSPKVAEFTIAVAPKLVADGIWTPEQLVRAARLWVWKSPGSPALAILLDAQCADQSAGDQWCRLAAERSERLRASESLTQVGATAPATPPSLAPLLTELGISDAGVGPSTFKHGAIETWSDPAVAAEWKWSSMVNAPNFNEALATGGIDSWQPFAGEHALRIDGLWQAPDTGPNPARSGYWSVPTQTLPAGSAWLLSFAYRTSGDEPSATVWLGANPASTRRSLRCRAPTAHGGKRGSCWSTRVQPTLGCGHFCAIGESRQSGLMRSSSSLCQVSMWRPCPRVAAPGSHKID